MIGQTLGHYKILDKLGAGGMGEVYRAEDTTLKRQVAFKVLPPDLASSQERLDRFQREAESLAALNHPNIVHVYTVEEDEGTHFLTMELVEGQPLSHLIKRGGMPLERIFEITIPLADALATAHEKGIIHRDLKPANIMVTDEGRVKVLDFGLAKLRLPEPQVRGLRTVHEEETMKRLIAPLILVLLAGALLAEEGMWTLDNFPLGKIRESYGVEINDAWPARIQRSTTRIEGGCTGSFVSSDGLVLTNHHCVRRCIYQMSTAESNVEEEGFLARDRSEEVRCESEQLSVLVEAEEITTQVMKAIEGKEEVEANEIRKQTLTRLEQACEDASAASDTGKLSCETVSLYNGGQYFLYKYKRYDDVRLVFAPEVPIAAFGGDPDNFNFPRWCLDMSLLRAYEDGEPAKTPDYLTWRAEGPNEGELVFVTGHPGSTDRQLTVAELKTMRDVSLPHYLMRYAELRGRYIQYAKTGEEPYRTVSGPLLMTENGIKVRRNELSALLDDEIFARKIAEENRLREAVAADPELAAKYGSAWDEIAAAEAAYLTFRDEYLFLEAAVAFKGTLFNYARTLVRAAEERQNPNEERLREYTEAALPQLRQQTLANRPIYPDLEELELSFSLDKLREFLGPDSPYVKNVLGQVSPDTLAHDLVTGTGLDDPSYRERLWEGGMEAIEASEDPMILFARKVDPVAREYRKRYEDEVEAPEKQASERIAEARFAVDGTSNYPDATFTLRVSYGSVKGWEEKGEMVYPFTTIGALFPRVTDDDPFRLPATWLDAKQRLDPDIRFNFVATTDITGGNSGSPVIDREGNLVGLVFDGNIHSIAGSYWFDESVNRTVSVHPAVMLEALEQVYKADHLIEELSAK